LNSNLRGRLKTLLHRALPAACLLLVWITPLRAQTPTLNSISPAFGAAGTSFSVTLTGTGFGAPMTVNAASGNVTNLNVTNLNIINSTTATATVAIPADAPAGTSGLTVTTSGGASNPVSLRIFPSILAINPGQTIAGSLSPVAEDIYQLTLNTVTTLTIDLRSADVNPQLYVYSASGSVLYSGVSGTGYSQVRATLLAGTYFIGATSNTLATGAYTISINVLPALTNISPYFAIAGTSVPLTLVGSGFGAPMTVNAGSSTVSNLNIFGSSIASGTITVPAGTPSGSMPITVTTPAGTSNPLSLSIFSSAASISPGQAITASLDGADGINPFFTSAFADLYQLTLNATTAVTIDLRSTGFNPQVYLFSSPASLLNSGTSGPGYSQLRTTLPAGTYYIEASSTAGGATGAYTISINVLPSLISISPPFVIAGTPMVMTLTGSRFGAPMTVGVGSGAASNVTVVNSTLANATVSMPAIAPAGSTPITVTTSTGTSNPVNVSVFAAAIPLVAGETISASLDVTDARGPSGSGFADLYQLTLNATTAVTLDLRSAAFTPQVSAFSQSGSSVGFATAGPGYAQWTGTLGPGMYYVTAGSGFAAATGSYTISFNVLPVLTSISPPFLAVGTAAPVTLTGARFGAPMTVSVGSGATVTDLNIVNPGQATATINVPGGTPAGTTTVTVTTSTGTSNPVSLSLFPSIPSISPGQTITASLDATDGKIQSLNSAFADLYQLTLNTTTTVTIDQRSAAFNPQLYLLGQGGVIVSFATNGTGYSQITRTLLPGTYYVDASATNSNSTGAYTISINVLPALTSITPLFAIAGTPATVTLAGARFGSPMTVNIGSGNVGNLNVASSASATGTINIPAGTPPGSAQVTVTTSTGTSNPLSLSIFAPPILISVGQTIAGSLDVTDAKSPFFSSGLADLYQLNLNATTAVTIDLRSAAFSPILYLFSAFGSQLNQATSGTGYSQISTTLSAGTYYLMAVSTFQTGSYTISINVLPALTSISPQFVATGTSTPVVLAGARFGAPMTVNIGSGTVTNVNVVTSTSATATINMPGGMPAGSTSVSVTTPDGTSNSVSLSVFPSIPPISPGQTISASLDVTDGKDPFFSPAFADLYQLTLNSTTAVTVDLRSTAFNPQLRLLSSSGSTMNSGTSGTGYAQVAMSLPAGTYYIDASSNFSNATGAYTISINVLPALASISPTFAIAGTSVPVTLTGAQFGAGMTVVAGSGNVSNLNIQNSTSATATITVPANTPGGILTVTATTSDGTSNPLSFFVFPSVSAISPGQTIAASLDPTDGKNPFFTFALADLYQLTLSDTTTVTIDQRSSAFSPRLALFTPSGMLVNIGSFGSGYSQIAMTLQAGTYYIAASANASNATGAYTISVNVLPALTRISPPFAAAGASLPVTLTGARFGAPMTVTVGSGTVSNVNVITPSSASATINFPDGTPAGSAMATATTSDGSSNAVLVSVFPSMVSISPGQTISAVLDTTDEKYPFPSSPFSDLYQLTLNAGTSVTIAEKSVAFDTYVYLYGSDGTLLQSNDNGPSGTDSQVISTLSAGTYYIIASSSGTGIGPYTLSINIGKRVPPQITAQ
jgi:hypothetical protein